MYYIDNNNYISWAKITRFLLEIDKCQINWGNLNEQFYMIQNKII